MRGTCEQLTISENEGRKELRLGEERDGLRRVNSCFVFVPRILFLRGIVCCNGQLCGKQEVRNYIFILQELEEEDGRRNVGEKEEGCQVKDSHRGSKHARCGKKGTRCMSGRERGRG